MRDSFVTWMIAGPPHRDDIAEARRLAHLTAIRGARADARSAGSLGIVARIARMARSARMARFVRHEVRGEQTPVSLADCCAAA